MVSPCIETAWLQSGDMGTAAEEDAAGAVRRQAGHPGQRVWVPDLDFAAVAYRQPELVAAGGELHVQDRRPGFQGGDDLVGFAVDHLHLMVIRVGEVDPNLPGIRAGHDEDRLAGYLDGAGLLPAAAVHYQHLVPAHR